MTIIVDGNNIMGQTPGWHVDFAKSRNELLRKIADYAWLKKSRVTVVFDGAPHEGMPDGAALRGVKVRYSSAESSADDLIFHLVESSKDKRGLTVVTSDRNLAFRVRSEGASVIRSGEFTRDMEDLLISSGCDDKEKQIVDADVDEWLAYFGLKK